ncbi:coiled-coil domain-containing protein [Chryseosolibacter indicus]|uniref:Ezrin/radixin/moesin family protein n=1 Tax=Chryseosolibacter indicus TaxID=2782351 RepID=A0ABS5VRW5_9BACT|nr:Ezrin/radixin/moesin family protein [Chryseosolibacter indicus]MBT1704188.1 Ezrin/radixin/moesin family protein [Chryseosolibacter indicus]
MNYRLITIFCLALIFSASQSFSQLSKQEKKEWKKKAKEYSKNPANLKQLLDEKDAAQSEVASLNAKVSDLQSKVSDKDVKIVELEDQLSQARAQLTAAKAELSQAKETPVINPMDFSKGVVFKVQIGAFKNKDLAKYFENNPNFGGEVKENEPQKITIGIFRDYWEADKFKKYMREMGVKDAWIVPYRDGTRVEIKDVLEGVVNAKPAEGTY